MSIGQPTYYTRHPDGTYSVADPQPVEPVKRPQNCGTGYCSCIECPYEPVKQEPVVTERQFKLAMKQWEDWKAYALELQEKLVKHEGGSPMILNTAPVQPVKQEPVAWAHPSGGYLSDKYIKEFATGMEIANYNIPLYAAPVDAKAIRADLMKQVMDTCEAEYKNYDQLVVEEDTGHEEATAMIHLMRKLEKLK